MGYSYLLKLTQIEIYNSDLTCSKYNSWFRLHCLSFASFPCQSIVPPSILPVASKYLRFLLLFCPPHPNRQQTLPSIWPHCKANIILPLLDSCNILLTSHFAARLALLWQKKISNFCAQGHLRASHLRIKCDILSVASKILMILSQVTSLTLLQLTYLTLLYIISSFVIPNVILIEIAFSSCTNHNNAYLIS